MLEEDFLPKKICATCFLKIESVDKFAFSAAKNQECFLSWLQNSQLDENVQQTTIETSTNSDFSFSNITIKKEFNHRQQIVFQPQKVRNARHVDHITLEQIINDQIIKNPKLPASTTITKIDENTKRQRIQNQQQQKNEATNISIVSYNNLQIGQVIKDCELLKLILRALKWEEYDRKASYNELIERLKRSNCRDILTNKNLLSDNDVVQLLRSYVNDSMMMSFKQQQVSLPASTTATTTTQPHQNISKIFQSQSPSSQNVPAGKRRTSSHNLHHDSSNVSSEEAMEVSIDPDQVFLADEETVMIDDEDEGDENENGEEDTTSALETKIETAKLMENEARSNGNYICSSCPQKFSSSTDLENHVTNHLISTTSAKSSSHNNNNNNNRKSTTSTTTRSAIALSATADEEIEKTTTSTKKKKSRDEKLRPKRKKIVIRINPSPKRNIRERVKATPFSCPICSKNLSSKRNLQLHIDTHKNKNGKFSCESDGCKKIFCKIENLLKHKLEAHERPSKRKKNQNEK